MFEWWKDLIRPIRISDSRFGDLRYLRDARFWEGKSPFAPLDREVEVLIDGDANGPTDRQRVFFDEIESRYDALWPAIEGKLEVEARNLELANDVEFSLVGLQVPDVPGDQAEWDLSYETVPPSWHFTVTVSGWSPVNVIAEN